MNVFECVCVCVCFPNDSLRIPYEVTRDVLVISERYNYILHVTAREGED